MSAHRAPLGDLIGQSFHRLTILAEVPTPAQAQRRVSCRCDCGRTKTFFLNNVKRGFSMSCGCWIRDQTTARNTSHGLSHVPEYKIWLDMKRRCVNPRRRGYEDYGGRGIYVCVRWRDSFLLFYLDMGPRPSSRHTIERLNNDGPYSPENCVWALRREQANNSRRNHRLTWNGETHSLSEWARRRGLPNPHIILKRLRRGWSIEKALTAPIAGAGR